MDKSVLQRGFWVGRDTVIATSLLLWVALSFFVNPKFGAGIYLSQIWLIVLIFYIVFAHGITHSNLSFLVIILAGMIILSPIHLFNFDFPILFFVRDQFKIFLLLLGIIAVSNLKVDQIDSLVKVIPFFVLLLVLHAYLTGIWDYYDVLAHRFGVPSLGSSNSLAFVLATSILILHYSWHDAGYGKRMMQTVVAVALIVTLLATQSRGGLLAYTIGAIFFVRNSRIRYAIVIGIVLFAVMLIFAFVQLEISVLQRLVMLSKVSSLSETGRGAIWMTFIGRVTDSPMSFLIGLGPGSTNIESLRQTVTSAHSIIVTLFVWYGALGLLLYFGGAAYLFVFTQGLGVEPFARFRKGLFWLLLFEGLYDSHILSGQLLWFNAICYGILLMQPVESQFFRANQKQ